MAQVTIKVNDLVSCNKGVTPDEGKVVYDRLMSEFKDDNQVVLDFAGIEMTTTAYLNVAIGDLYKSYTSEQLKERLSFNHVSEATARRIKNVTETAKLFYKNESKFNQSVESILNEHL